jgi:hypothetical protein
MTYQYGILVSQGGNYMGGYFQVPPHLIERLVDSIHTAVRADNKVGIILDQIRAEGFEVGMLLVTQVECNILVENITSYTGPDDAFIRSVRMITS